jgi:hypothetical protein
MLTLFQCLVGIRDNQTNQRIAELSRNDSTDMRIIAAVTLFFLPATFMAVSVSAPGNGVLLLTSNRPSSAQHFSTFEPRRTDECRQWASESTLA